MLAPMGVMGGMLVEKGGLDVRGFLRTPFERGNAFGRPLILSRTNYDDDVI